MLVRTSMPVPDATIPPDPLMLPASEKVCEFGLMVATSPLGTTIFDERLKLPPAESDRIAPREGQFAAAAAQIVSQNLQRAAIGNRGPAGVGVGCAQHHQAAPLHQHRAWSR